jgi:hypothetical protein
MSEQNDELSLLANIAAQLLQGDDYATAVKRAVELISECKRFHRERARKVQIFQEAREKAKVKDQQWTNLSEAEKEFRPWEKAVKQITNKRTETNATEAFRSFFEDACVPMRHVVKEDDEDEEHFKERVKDYVAGCIKAWRKSGMTGVEIENFREQYQAMPRRGPRQRQKSFGGIRRTLK